MKIFRSLYYLIRYGGLRDALRDATHAAAEGWRTGETVDTDTFLAAKHGWKPLPHPTSDGKEEGPMTISHETVSAFVRECGPVSVLDTTGKVRRLNSGEPDWFDLIERADRFQFSGKWYTRREFEKLIGAKLKKSHDS